MANTDHLTLAPSSDAGLRSPTVSYHAGRYNVGPISTSIHSDMSTLEAEWRTLDENDANSLHQSFDWCAAWKETHDSELLIVRGSLDGRLLFILPFEIERGRLFRTARLIGSAHSNLNTGLFASEIDKAPREELLAAITRGLRRKLRPFADVVTLDRTPATWRGMPHPLAALPGTLNPDASFQLPLLGTMERTLAQINTKRRRKKMRISERRLAEIGGYDYVIARGGPDAHELLETFFRQKAARFEAHGLPDAFRHPETRAFFHALIDAGTSGLEDGALLELNAIRLKGQHEGRIVAIAGLSRKGDHVICQFGSIDEFAADSSPGELLFYRAIERLSAEGVTLFDFGVGDQPYKRSWCTVETPLRDIILPLTLRGHLAAGVRRATAQAKRAIKGNQALYAFIQQRRRQMMESTGGASDD